MVSGASGWCAGATSRAACHSSRTEKRPCVWSDGRCGKGYPHGSVQAPTCPAPGRGAGSGASAGWVVTEFEPNVSWAGVDNTIACSAGHHLMEGRWLRNTTFMDDYSRFWFDPLGGAQPRAYTFWAATAMLERYNVVGDIELLRQLAPRLADNYDTWLATHWSAAHKCFWQ